MVYCFVCDGCGGTIAVERPMKDCRKPQRCECNTFIKGQIVRTLMRRDFQAEHTTTNSGDLKWVMRSMAMHPDQVAEHKRLFPKIDVEKTPGGYYAPVARSLAEKRAILKIRGWIDKQAYC